MKRIVPLLLILHSSLFILRSPAAVPLKWTVETSRVQPVVFDAVRGETLALEASFKSYGTDVSTSNLTAKLYWQTNGMDTAWWVTNAVTSGSSASVLFTPDMDPGAPVVHAFLALDSSTNSSLLTSRSSLSYRAALTLRFRHGPGATPNALALPTPTIDCAAVTFLNPSNAPWASASYSSNSIASDVSCLSSMSDLTNAVAAVVTNDVPVYGAWTTGQKYISDDDNLECVAVRYHEGQWQMFQRGRMSGSDFNQWFNSAIFDPNITTLTVGVLTSTRTVTSSNALGLAYLRDVPSTNGLASSTALASLTSRVTGLASSFTYLTNAYIRADCAAFSNEVAQVKFGISSNDVAVIRSMAGTIGNLPIEGGAATLGGLLAALVAAVVWLKTNALRKGMTDGVPDDPNVSTLFTSANASLMTAADYTMKTAQVALDRTVQYFSTNAAFTLTVPSAKTEGTDGKATDMVLYVTNTDASNDIVMTLDTSVEWHYDGETATATGGTIKIPKGALSAIYVSEIGKNASDQRMFIAKLWTPGQSAAVVTAS